MSRSNSRVNGTCSLIRKSAGDANRIRSDVVSNDMGACCGDRLNVYGDGEHVMSFGKLPPDEQGVSAPPPAAAGMELEARRHSDGLQTDGGRTGVTKLAGGATIKRCKSFSVNDAGKDGKEKKNFFRQIFQSKSKDKTLVKRGLWGVVQIVNNNAADDDDVSTDKKARRRLSSESEREKKIKPKKVKIPTILINGVEFTDHLEEGAEEVKPRIRDMFDELDSHCSVSGEGIFGGYEHEPSIFYAQTKNEFDKSKFKVAIKGPKQRPIRTESVLVDANRCQFTYWPRRTGYYTLYVTWEDKHVVGSPFTISIN